MKERTLRVQPCNFMDYNQRRALHPWRRKRWEMHSQVCMDGSQEFMSRRWRREKVKLAFRTSDVQAVKRPEPKAGSKRWVCNDKPLPVNIRVRLPFLISGHKTENCWHVKPWAEARRWQNSRDAGSWRVTGSPLFLTRDPVVVQSLSRVDSAPHGPQHARLPCPSLAPCACSNSCPLSRWCPPTTSSSVAPGTYLILDETKLVGRAGSLCFRHMCHF